MCLVPSDVRRFFYHLRWARRSLRPESTSRRRLFEQSEFLSHLIRDGGGGIPESLLLSRLGGPRTGRNGFGSFCRNKRDSSRGGETPFSLNPNNLLANDTRKKHPSTWLRRDAAATKKRYFLLANQQTTVLHKKWDEDQCQNSRKFDQDIERRA